MKSSAKGTNRASISFQNHSSGEIQLRQVFDLCVRKTRNNIKRLADEPKSAASDENGDFFNYKESFYEIGNWTSSFFTGMALMAWRETEDEYFLKQTLRLAPCYREKVFNRHLDTHHDLGFLASLYSVALFKLTGDEEHRVVGLRAAAVLSQRFNENGNFIRAWGHLNTTEHDNMAIIDCLMNLPLLYWATNETGDGKYRDIAVRHADMVLKYFVRPDYSVCHAFRFDLKTGGPIGPDNYCGWSVDSYWARGAAWAIYGFALTYGHTRQDKYLQAAVELAKKFIKQLDDEVVPVWDFRLTPDAPRIRDASAATVMICGLQELSKHGVADGQLLKAKSALLNTICTETYLSFSESCPGILKDGQVGIGRSRNAFTSWGDYFLMEAVSRELFQAETWW